MENLNSVIVTGNLTRDPEVRETKNGNHVCRFSIAHGWFNKASNTKTTSYFDCKAWNEEAKKFYQNASKGTRVKVIGRLEQENWTDKLTGKERSKVVILANEIELSEPRMARGNLETEECPFL